jgi:TatD-related deoxyribonuclease
VTLPPGLPVVDHHCHLSPTGEGIAAARRFRDAGGTHLFLATQSYAPGVPRTLDGYRAQFETTERLGSAIRRDAGVVVYLVVAPYPIDLVHVAPELGLAQALGLQREALDLAGRWVAEHRAVALGEVGRAHFPVAPDMAEAIESAFAHALAVARDVHCPAVVHSADLDGEGYRELSDRAIAAGLPSGRVVKHYARARVVPDATGGVVPSYLARRDLVREVLRDPGPWFLETDFLDDPARRGAVLDLATVPRRAEAVASLGAEMGERLWVPFSESVEKVYGFRPEVTQGGVR